MTCWLEMDLCTGDTHGREKKGDVFMTYIRRQSIVEACWTRLEI